MIEPKEHCQINERVSFPISNLYECILHRLYRAGNVDIGKIRFEEIIGFAVNVYYGSEWLNVSVTNELFEKWEHTCSPAVCNPHPVPRYTTEQLIIDIIGLEIEESVSELEERYPTIWAYEQACKSLEKYKRRAEELEIKIGQSLPMLQVGGCIEEIKKFLSNEETKALVVLCYKDENGVYHQMTLDDYKKLAKKEYDDLRHKALAELSALDQEYGFQ
jgi:uncharacterized protein YjhX (UPF0386 family)